MQRKILNTKKVLSETCVQNGQEKLHSIPMLNNIKYMKNNVLYSIPCVAALLLVGCLTVLSSYPTYAKVPIATNGDGSSTATLSLSNPTMTSNAVVPGEVATTSTNVIVEVKNAESYSLTLSVDNANLTNDSTTLVPGNAIADNTWGYKWDNASTYTAPSTTGTTLATPALTDNAVSFTKTLTFGAKFATNADAGTYHGSGKLSLAATPQAVTNVFGVETMQEMTRAICKKASTGDSAVLSDTSSGNENETYTVTKMNDGNCWMTKNMNNSTGRSYTDTTYGGYYTFTSAMSVCTHISEEWNLPIKMQYDTLTKNITSQQILAAPYNFLYGGIGTANGPNGAGNGGYYSTHTVYPSGGGYIYTFNISNSSVKTSTGSSGTPYSVRCMISSDGVPEDPDEEIL